MKWSFDSKAVFDLLRPPAWKSLQALGHKAGDAIAYMASGYIKSKTAVRPRALLSASLFNWRTAKSGCLGRRLKAARKTKFFCRLISMPKNAPTRHDGQLKRGKNVDKYVQAPVIGDFRPSCAALFIRRQVVGPRLDTSPQVAKNARGLVHFGDECPLSDCQTDAPPILPRWCFSWSTTG